MMELTSNLPLQTPTIETTSCLPTLDSIIPKLLSSFFFETYVITFGFGLVLYVADIVSDLVNGFVYIQHNHIWWGVQSMGLVLLPGLVRGVYELSRRQVFYKNNARSFQLKGKAEYQLFKSLNFGLDVLPNMVIELPNSTALALILAPMYALIMAVWFPVLPIIQYSKLFHLQLSARRSWQVSETAFDKLVDERRRAIATKAVETFLELFLQVYITYNRNHSDTVISSLISMCLSFLSLLKTSYDLQEVDRLDSAVSSPRKILMYFTTSMLCFGSTIFFRCLSLSMLSLYLNQYAHLQGILAVPIALLVAALAGNCALRFYVKKRGALLNGVMSAIAPARFICTSRTYGTENLTRHYLIAYTAFNTLAHYVGLGVVCGINHSVEFHQDVLANRKWIHLVVLPVTGAVGLLSVVSTLIHWKYSLRNLFRTEFKHPDYQRESDRVSSFLKRSKYGASFSPQEFARSGFFCLNPAKGWPIVCYDCGLIIQEVGGFKSIDVLHAASLLKYKISYLASPKLTESQNPDLILQAYCRTLRVRPVCGVLDRLRVDFKHFPLRLESHLQEDLKEASEGVEELASAGFVRTSKMTMACFQCCASLDWSDHKVRTHSPWALHAWSREGFECKYLLQRLREHSLRLKTFPSAWSLVHHPDVPTPEELSTAGFYCVLWHKKGRAWVKCFACKAFGFHWTTAAISRLQDLAEMAKEIGHTETPGESYGYLEKYRQRKRPIVHHYSQNMNCGFVQEILASSIARLGTFPLDWRESNGLSVDRKEVADAGFVYYPYKYTKLGPHVIAGVTQAKTICPRCLLQVDWATEERRPSDVSHCLATRLLLEDIKQRSDSKTSELDLSEHFLRTLHETVV